MTDRSPLNCTHTHLRPLSSSIPSPRTLDKTGTFNATTKTVTWTINATKTQGAATNYKVTGVVLLTLAAGQTGGTLAVSSVHTTGGGCVVDDGAASCNLGSIGTKTCPYTCSTGSSTPTTVSATYTSGAISFNGNKTDITYTQVPSADSAQLTDELLEISQSLTDTTTLTVDKKLCCPSTECSCNKASNWAKLLPLGGSEIIKFAHVDVDCGCNPPAGPINLVDGAGSYDVPSVW